MDGMLPVWDFSIPDLEQLQAEQAELIWEPHLDDTDADLQVILGLPNLSTQAALPSGSAGLSTATTSGRPENNSFRYSAPEAKVDNTRQASQSAARQESYPTPSPADNSARDEDEDPNQPSQRQRTGSSDNSERNKAVNRESQRRFRLRQKVHETTTLLLQCLSPGAGSCRQTALRLFWPTTSIHCRHGRKPWKPSLQAQQQS